MKNFEQHPKIIRRHKQLYKIKSKMPFQYNTSTSREMSGKSTPSLSIQRISNKVVIS